MWEAYELGHEDLLWTCTAFNGGIAGHQQAPCGAISAAIVCTGLLRRCSLMDEKAANQSRFDAREDASEMIKAFIGKFGTIMCRDLVGLDFSKPESFYKSEEIDMSKEKCDKYVEFVIEKLYEIDQRRRAARIPEKVVIYTTPGCPFCARAKKDLEARGIIYDEISSESNPEVIEEVMRLSGGTGLLPIVVRGEEVTVGFGGG